MNKRQAGASWEEAAVRYLKRQGVAVTERNFHCSQGEIDIIGYHHGCLCFFEVKYRKDDAFGSAAEAVDGRKQNRICRCADVYLYQRHIPQDTAVRFDVVAICADTVKWIPNAFDYREKRRTKWR